MAQARHAEQAVMAGGRLGLLHGIPFTVKDIVNTKGVTTTFGAVPFRGNVPEEDAVAMARLRAVGAILIGKTTTPEFGSKCFTDSPLFGRTRNAWDPVRTSGGSSGGAAVAVACGLAPLAVATDGGGSTRIPAACNGVVGIKQSLGVVPHSQAPDLFGNQTYVTPMTRKVADTALMLQAMAGEHDCDPWSAGIATEDFVQAVKAVGDLRGSKVLYCLAPPGRPVSRAVAKAFEDSLARLASLGAELEAFTGSTSTSSRSGAPSTKRCGAHVSTRSRSSMARRSAPPSAGNWLRPPRLPVSTTRRRCSNAAACSCMCSVAGE